MAQVATVYLALPHSFSDRSLLHSYDLGLGLLLLP